MKILSWGPNKDGQHGSNDYEDYSSPNSISLTFHLNDIQTIICGSTFSFIITKTGLVYACGNNKKGQISLEEVGCINFFVPLKNIFNIPVKTITAGWDFSVILTEFGQIYSTGDNKHCQLGFDNSVEKLSKFQLVNLPEMKSVKAGMWHVIALSTNNEIWTWGYNHKAQLGIWPVTRSGCVPECRPLNNETEIVFIIAGAYNSGFMNKNYDLIMWGCNQYGQCGISDEDEIHGKLIKPRKMQSSLSGIVQLESGWLHCLARDSDGNCFSWGQNTYSQLGRHLSDNADHDPRPGLVDYFKENHIRIKEITAGNHHNLAVDSDNSLWSWGWNDHGILGVGDFVDRIVPERVSKLSSSVSLISKGGSHSFVVIE